jgi:hypothetical protein
MSYLDKVLKPISHLNTVDDVLTAIRESKIEFDFIAVRGMSGALIAGSISTNLMKPIVVVRKGESSHGLPIEYSDMNALTTHKKYIIIDDGVGSGDTIVRMLMMLNSKTNFIHTNCECVGVFLYAQDSISLDDINCKKDAVKLMMSNEKIHIKLPIYDISNKITTVLDTTKMVAKLTTA